MVNIPYQNIEIEQIYTQLLSQPRTAIAVCSAEEGEGVTSLAFALAQRNLLAGHSTLLVDLNLYRPAIKSLLNISIIEQTMTDNKISVGTADIPPTHKGAVPILAEPQLICQEDNNGPFTGFISNAVVLNGVIAPTKREDIIKLRQPGVLEQCINGWLTQYDTVIIDTSPLNRVNAQNIPAERIAAACDGAILIVLAGQTTQASINGALAKLKTANAKLLGCVLNDRDNPTLKYELLRQLQRMEPLFLCLTRPFKNMINKSRFLKLEV